MVKIENDSAFSTLAKPYLEVGVGVENILKILRVDFLWRLSYVNGEYIDAYKQRFPGSRAPAQFGIRASLQFVF